MSAKANSLGLTPEQLNKIEEKQRALWNRKQSLVEKRHKTELEIIDVENEITALDRVLKYEKEGWSAE